MTVRFNAVDDQWVPCVRGSTPGLASVGEVFTPGSDLKLTMTPWKQLPLRNFLVAIATSALRPKTNEDIWGYVEDKDSACSAIQGYLDVNKERFNLFDPKAPLFQVAFMETDYPLNGSGFTRRETHVLATLEGSSTVAIKTPLDKELSLGGTLLALLNSQVIGCNMKYGVSKPAGPKLVPRGQVQAAQAGISCFVSTNGGSTSTLNLSVAGSNLLATVFLNMIAEEDILPVYSKGFGYPAWEHDVWDDFGKMQAAAQDLTETFLGRLVPMTKFLWVDPEKPEEMIYSASEGLDYQTFLSVLKNAKGYDRSYFFPPASATGKATLGAYQEGSYLWQEQASLDVVKDTPKVLMKFQGSSKEVTCIATALVASASMGLVTSEQEISSSVAWPAGLLSGYLSGAQKYGEFSSEAMTVAKGMKGVKGWNLSWALSRYCEDMNLNPKGKYFEALKASLLRGYWERLDKEFPGYLGRAAELAEWRSLCVSVAKGQLRGLMDANPRNNKAIIKACS